MNGKLVNYIEKAKKKKKRPNITKLAEATMPKGRERKGSECPRKRKSSATIETHLENPSFVAPSDTIVGSSHPLPTNQPPLNNTYFSQNYYQAPPITYQPESVWQVLAHPNCNIHLLYFAKYQATSVHVLGVETSTLRQLHLHRRI